MRPETPSPDEQDSVWRGRVDPDEHFRSTAVGGGPRGEQEAEAALARAWRALPAVPPLSSNFAAKVMAAVDRDERAAVRNVAFNRDWWLRWLRPLAAASAVCVAGAVGWLGWEIRARKDLARNVQEVSAWVGGAPGVEVLRDFEAIRAFEAGERTAGDVALMQAIVE